MLAALILGATIDGDAAFKVGDFAAAQSAYAAAAQANPRDLDAVLGLTRLAIYANDMNDAEAWLVVAQALAPDDRQVAADQRTIDARTNGSVDTVAPHRGPAVVPFLQTDPLPMIAVRVNGRDAHFLIDTGSPNITLDAGYAQSLGIATGEATQGTFAGGKHAAMLQATVDRLELGGWTIANVPATVVSLGGATMGALHVDGVLGTGLFAHFLTTIDYRGGRLILQDRTASAGFEQRAATQGATIVPMWFVGDHFVFVQGRAGDGPVGLFNVDTGGTFGVQLTKAALDAAHITPDASRPHGGMSPGGSVTVLPFTASVAVGGYSADGLSGVYFEQGDQYGIFPFTIAGTVSHEFFRKTTVTFDFVAMRLVIETHA